MFTHPSVVNIVHKREMPYYPQFHENSTIDHAVLGHPDRVLAPPEGFLSRFDPGFDRFRPTKHNDVGLWFSSTARAKFSSLAPILIIFDPKITPKMRFILVALDPPAYCCSRRLTVVLLLLLTIRTVLGA